MTQLTKLAACNAAIKHLQLAVAFLDVADEGIAAARATHALDTLGAFDGDDRQDLALRLETELSPAADELAI